MSQARSVLRFYDDFARACPDELSANAAFATAEDGTPVLAIAVAWIGPLDAGERLLKSLRSCESSLADSIAPMSYVALQNGGDTAFPRGRRHYWKAWDRLMLTQRDRPEDDERNIEWTRDLYTQMEPHLEPAVYVNDLGDDEGDASAPRTAPTMSE